MFGPVRGPWPDDSWQGWWGDEPPYHVPVFVLTHHARAPLVMKGGTTFHFVTDGIESAYAQARAAARGKDVRLGGGVATVREYLRAGLVDEMHLAIAPVVLGSGESLFADLDLARLGFRCVEHVPTQLTTHVVLRKDGSALQRKPAPTLQPSSAPAVRAGLRRVDGGWVQKPAGWRSGCH